MDKSYGWIGKILRVDLTNNDFSVEPTSKYAKRFIGGRAVGQWILFNEMGSGVNAFDPENLLIIGTGPLVGTLAPTAGRTNFDSINAYNNGVGYGNLGGHFGPELKYAGFDHVVIKGRANKPSFLAIRDGETEIMDGSSIWGKTTWETEDIIRGDFGDDMVRVASIGPAGERLVKAGCIIADKARAAGGCGLGAVMGSKNLKAVAVRGTGSIEVADPEKFMKLIDKAWWKVDSSKGVSMMRKSGTHGTYTKTMNNVFSAICTRNAQDDHWDEKKMESIDQPAYDKYEVRRIGCFCCPIYCSHYYRITDGPYSGIELEGFEANAAFGFGSRFDIDYPPAIAKAHELLSKLGMDNDNVAVPLSWAYECFEKGILTKKDLDGFELKWGDHETLMNFIEKMAFREGFGDLLAEGVYVASKKVGKGSERYATTIKKQEMIESVRATVGWGFGIATSTRAARHLDGAPTTEMQGASKETCIRIFGVPTCGDGLSYEGKAKLVFWFERYKELVDMLQMCYYTSYWLGLDLLSPDDYAGLLSAATGVKYTGKKLMEIGRKAHNVEKAFNTLHANFTRGDDYLPQRFMKEPIQTGKHKGIFIDRTKWDKLLDQYYELQGWDKKTGLQTEECLNKLELNEVAEKLKEEGKLSSP